MIISQYLDIILGCKNGRLGINESPDYSTVLLYNLQFFLHVFHLTSFHTLNFLPSDVFSSNSSLSLKVQSVAFIIISVLMVHLPSFIVMKIVGFPTLASVAMRAPTPDKFNIHKHVAHKNSLTS